MSLSREEWTELFHKGFTVEEVRPNGKTDVYRGRDEQRFWDRADDRYHEHKV